MAIFYHASLTLLSSYKNYHFELAKSAPLNSKDDSFQKRCDLIGTGHRRGENERKYDTSEQEDTAEKIEKKCTSTKCVSEEQKRDVEEINEQIRKETGERQSKNADKRQEMSRLVGKPTMWFPNRSDTNRPVKAQKEARNLKFRI